MGRLSLPLPGCLPFNLDATLGCGQVFRWRKTGSLWEGIVGRNIIGISQDPHGLHWSGASQKFVQEYFALDIDLPAILASIDRDPVIHKAIERCSGLRIVRQTPWECLASYICATFSNIPRIQGQVESLAVNLGEPIAGKSGEIRGYSFPTPERLAAAEIRCLEPCRLGYRTPFLMSAARVAAGDPEWVDRVHDLPTDDARKELMKFRGVGRKVADCVLLFAFERYDAVPVDIWVRRIVERCYPCPKDLSYQKINDVFRTNFGEYAGYAQEYLFCMRSELAGK